MKYSISLKKVLQHDYNINELLESRKLISICLELTFLFEIQKKSVFAYSVRVQIFYYLFYAHPWNTPFSHKFQVIHCKVKFQVVILLTYVTEVFQLNILAINKPNSNLSWMRLHFSCWENRVQEEPLPWNITHPLKFRALNLYMGQPVTCVQI